MHDRTFEMHMNYCVMTTIYYNSSYVCLGINHKSDMNKKS